MRSNTYHLLVASLPPLPRRFETDRLPISLERLHTRLRLLEPEDAATVDRMLDVLAWSRQVVEATDAAVVKRYGELVQQVTNPLAREVLAAGMDVRMIVAALRRRRHGLGPPAVGLGQWVEHIRHRFNERDFGLGNVLPWLEQFAALLDHDDVLNLYQQMLGAVWADLRTRADEYDVFSFEAVVLYVARWDIIRHWQQLQTERGRVVFDALVTEAMGEYAKLYS